MRIESDRRFRAIVVALVLFAVAVLAYYTLADRQADPDMFWHITAGRYIVTNLTIPTTDVFSWYGIENHLSWMPQAWLFDVAVYGVWLLGGFPLLYALTALISSAITGLVYWLFALRSNNRMLAIAVAALARWGVLPLLAPRPQMLTYALLLVLALLLEKKKWWWAVPVVLLGVNLHGPLYPIYLLVVAYYVLPKKWPVLAACVAAVFVTPFGASLVPYPFTSLLGSSAIAIQEFEAVAPVSWPAHLVALLLIVVLLNRRATPLKEMAGLVGLVVLSLVALRHMVFIFVLALPLVAPYLKLPSQHRRDDADSHADAPPVGSSNDDGVVAVHPRRGLAFVVLDWILVGVLAAGGAIGTYRAATVRLDVFKDYPVKAAEYLRTNGITRYANELGDGGFLIFLGMQPLIDGRGDPFITYPGGRRVTLNAEYAAVWYLEKDCRPFLDRNRITHLLLAKTSQLSAVLDQSSSFRRVYADETHAVYERLKDVSTGP